MSNPLLVTNLRNFLTGGDLSRERQFREAQESPQRFLDILTLLGDGENQERLKIFLECFNIPFDSDAQLRFRRPFFKAVATWQVERMRATGKCELKHFGSLHEAVLGFVERHQKLLDKHVDSESAGGIPNFLQILQTVCTLLLYQIEGTIDVMSRRSQIDMKAGEWNQVRKNLIRYYVELKKLLRLTTLKYLSKLAGLGPIGPEFSDSIPGLIDFYDRALADRDLLDRVRKKFFILTELRTTVPMPFIKAELLEDKKWETYFEEVTALQEELKRHLEPLEP